MANTQSDFSTKNSTASYVKGAGDEYQSGMEDVADRMSAAESQNVGTALKASVETQYIEQKEQAQAGIGINTSKMVKKATEKATQ